MNVQNDPACYVIFERDNKILLLLRTNTGFMDGTYSLPAGRVEAGETYREGAVREALEEAGLKVDVAQLSHRCTVHRCPEAGGYADAWSDVYFAADAWEGEPVNGEPDKHGDPEWFSLDALPSNIMPYQRYALDCIAQGVTYGEYGWQ